MKRYILPLFLLLALIVCLIPLLSACSDASDTATQATDTSVSPETTSEVESEVDTEPKTEAVTEDPYPNAISPEALGEPQITYACQDDSVLKTYENQSPEAFRNLCDYYLKNGYDPYAVSTKNGNLFETYVKDGAFAHIYFFPQKNELNLVTSETAGASLPPKQPTVITGDHPVTVTQMKDAAHVNGMGYIIQLADGSFIIYDGAYAEQTRPIYNFLKDAAGEGEILIRAWVLTHSHNDHYPTFRTFSKRYADKVKIEHVIIAPIDPETAVAHGGDKYLNTEVHESIAAFEGAKAVYAHTGMTFTFCNLKMEILMTADDVYKNGNHGNYFNNSSIVSRIYDDNYSALFLGDIGMRGTDLMEELYGDYLQSDMCQISHHGVEDVPLHFYERVKASILFYPCNLWLYDQTERHWDVRKALEERDYTKEILIAGLGEYTRAWGTTFEKDAPLSMPDYPTS